MYNLSVALVGARAARREVTTLDSRVAIAIVRL